MNDHDPVPIGTALHERVRDEWPDLDRLVSGSTHAGLRLRGRRTAAYSIGGTVGALALAATLGIAAHAAHRPGSSPPVATVPTASPSSATADAGPSSADDASADPAPTAGESAPVSLDAPGWRCGPAQDEKFICTRGAASVVVTWRPAAEHAEYLKVAKGGGLLVTDVHGAFFATVMAGPGATAATLDEAGRALVWKD